MTNLLEKVTKLGAETCLAIEDAYYSAGQLWWEGLTTIASKADCATADEMCGVEFCRAEHYFFSTEVNGAARDKVLRLESFKVKTHFGCIDMSNTVLTKRMLEVFEERREMRERQMCAVGCEVACALDFCKQSAKDLGHRGGWNCLLVSEESNLMGELVTEGVSLTDNSASAKKLRAWLHTIRQRPNFNGSVLVIDNVPPQMLDGEGRIDSKIVRILTSPEVMGAIGDGKKGIQHVLQDRFHVAHSFSPKFNNLDPRYFEVRASSSLPSP